MKSQEKYSQLMDAVKEFYADGYDLIDAIDLVSDMHPDGLSDEELDDIAERKKT